MMYHCSLLVQIFSQDASIEAALRKIHPPERFSLSFQTYSVFSLEQQVGDIIIFDLPLNTTLPQIRKLCRPKALFIFCADQNVLTNETKLVYDVMDDLWFKPLLPDFLSFRFRKLLECLKSKKDQQLYENYLHTAMDSIPDLVWFKDARGSHLKVNRAFCEAVGKTKQNIEGRGHFYIWDIKPEEYEQSEYICLESEEIVLRKKKTCTFDEKVKSKHGMRQFKTYKSPLIDENGTVMGTVGIAHDVTDLENMGAELEIILNNMPFAILLKNETGRIINVNKKFEAYFHESKSSLLGRDYSIWKNSTLCFMDQATDEGYRMASCCFKGKQRIFEVQEEKILDSFGFLAGYFCLFRDITLEHFLKAQILNNANTDFLTGLYNRRYFYEFVTAQRDRRQISLLSIDLDNFKQVNDTFGHQAGDAALIVTANAIKASFLEDFVVRLGGDEFLVVLLDPLAPPILMQRASALQQLLQEIFQASAEYRAMTASIGIVWTTDADLDIDELLRRCDLALYEAKQSGKARCCMYSDSEIGKKLP